MKLALDGTTVVVTGRVFPPSESLRESTEEILSKAYDAVEREKQRKDAAHNSLVEQYAKAAGVPVVED
ncbi:MAG: hypothetical protein HC788_12670 [Sphingopyxis sp.]|nr:hypothetical protein [Sphingopyxis sp.]